MLLKLRALIAAINQSDLPAADKKKLRQALYFDGFFRRDAFQIADTALAAAGMLPADGAYGAIDWAALVKFFIEVVLPLLLSLFAERG